MLVRAYALFVYYSVDCSGVVGIPVPRPEILSRPSYRLTCLRRIIQKRALTKEVCILIILLIYNENVQYSSDFTHCLTNDQYLIKCCENCTRQAQNWPDEEQRIIEFSIRFSMNPNSKVINNFLSLGRKNAPMIQSQHLGELFSIRDFLE